MTASEFADVEIERYTQAPLQMTKTVTLKATPKQVFATLSEYESMPEWFPGMSSVIVDNTQALADNAEGAVRACSFGEQSMTEDIVLFDAPHKLAYAIRDGNFMGMSEHFALVTVEPASGGSLLTWHQFFNHSDPKAFKVQGGAMLDGAFENLKARFS